MIYYNKKTSSDSFPWLLSNLLTSKKDLSSFIDFELSLLLAVCGTIAQTNPHTIFTFIICSCFDKLLLVEDGKFVVFVIPCYATMCNILWPLVIILYMSLWLMLL